MPGMAARCEAAKGRIQPMICTPGTGVESAALSPLNSAALMEKKRERLGSSRSKENVPCILGIPTASSGYF